MLDKGKALDPTIAAFVASFLSITVSELGDKTQLGLMMMSATLRKPTTIFLGKRLAMGKVRQISAIVFMAIGILRLLEII